MTPQESKLLKKIKKEQNLIASELNNTIVINGDALDEEVLLEANIDETTNSASSYK